MFVTRRLPAPGTQPLVDAGLRVASHDCDHTLAQEDLVRHAAGARALVCMVNDRVDAAVLEAASELAIVANLGVGHDNIDVALARSRGIVVTNTPDVLAEATADLTWALILGVARLIVPGDAKVRSGHWSGWTPTELLGMELGGRTLGIVGMGAIGAAVARRASGFGMRVLYHNRRPRPAEEAGGAGYVDLDELLGQSDVVTLHAPLTDATRHLIGAPELRAMKPEAILVNTSRGGLVDQSALVDALRSCTIAAAGLDVYEDEPEVPEPLRRLENAVLLPHLGSATRTTRQRMVELACANAIAVLGGRPALTPVHPAQQRRPSVG